jgi:quercetin dioxygenase-like cupin family protein
VGIAGDCSLDVRVEGLGTHDARKPSLSCRNALAPGDNLSVVEVPPRSAGLPTGVRWVKATRESTGGALSAWESTFPGGLASPLHVHHNAAEFFYVLEGEVAFYVGDEWFEAEPGAYVAVPRDARHGFRVRSQEARMLAVFAPAAMLEMWEEIAANGWPADAEAYAELAGNHGMEEFGPLPKH